MVKFISNKNTDGNATVLFGINIDKFFMPSVANIIGVDLKKYKVVKKYQFACNRMHVGRDKRLPISMSTFGYDFIVSPAYDVFEVTSSDVLPEYLMLWFRRKEFDRQCWFYTDADVRGGLHLDALKSIEVKIPSIEEQRQIVAQYETIANKIKVNEQICEKLEATAQAIYKHWFVDFEFSNEAGKLYKSSGGKMVWNDELGKEIPEGWGIVKLQHLIDNDYIFKNQDGNHGEIHPKSSDFVHKGVPFVMVNNVKKYCADLTNCNFISNDQARKLRIGFAKDNDVLITHKATIGKTVMLFTNHEKVVLTPQITYYRIKDKHKMRSSFLYSVFKSQEFQNQFAAFSEQSTRSYLSILNQRFLEILLPTSNVIINYDKQTAVLLKQIYNYTQINQKLKQLQSLLLSRLATLEK